MSAPEGGLMEDKSDDRVWLTPAQAARRLGVSEEALRRLRRVGGGPQFGKRGRIVRYEAAVLDEWMRSGK